LRVNKVILLICDGMSDRPIDSLNGKTPLEVANTPNLDYVASVGITGIMDPIAPGVPASSDCAHLSIFGYDIEKEYPGRGPIEALGAGLDLPEGAIAFRANFATVEEGEINGVKTLIIKDRRAGRIRGDDLKDLTNSVNDVLKELKNIEGKFIPTSEHRGILVLTGENLSHEVTDSDPHKTGAPVCQVEPISESTNIKGSLKTADILNHVLINIYKRLKDHPINIKRIKAGELPANIILPRGAGIVRKVKSFNEKWGMKAACIAALALYKGVAKLIGMDLLNVKGATGYIDTDVEAKFNAAVNALDEYDFIYVHVKGTDSTSHDKRPDLKIKMIEKIDAALPILIEGALNSKRAYLVITSDHSSSCELGIHISAPTPVVIAGSNIVSDNVKAFNERTVLNGGLHRINGRELMPILLGYTARALESGLRPTPKRIPYIPHHVNPLKLL